MQHGTSLLIEKLAAFSRPPKPSACRGGHAVPWLGAVATLVLETGETLKRTVVDYTSSNGYAEKAGDAKGSTHTTVVSILVRPERCGDRSAPTVKGRRARGRRGKSRDRTGQQAGVDSHNGYLCYGVGHQPRFTGRVASWRRRHGIAGHPSR